MKQSGVLVVLGIFAGVFWASAAQASLVGDEIACDIAPADFWSCSAPTATVSTTDIEFQLLFNGAAFFDVDVTDDRVSLTFIQQTGGLIASSSELLLLSGLQWVDNLAGRIIGIDGFSTDAVAGVGAVDISFLSNAVIIDLDQTSWLFGQTLSFDLVTNDAPAEVVPIPPALLLFVCGLLGLRHAQRRPA